MLLLISYVVLKRRYPDNNWTYGKSWKKAIVLASFPAAGSLAMAVFTMIDDYTIFGVPRINLTAFLVVVGIGVFTHGTCGLVLICST